MTRISWVLLALFTTCAKSSSASTTLQQKEGSSLDGCALCDEKGIYWNDAVIRTRSDENGCKAFKVECPAPLYWKSQLMVNGRLLTSQTGENLQISIKCVGNQNGHRWAETQEMNVTNINSVVCTRKSVDRGCESCDSSSIAWLGDVHTNSSLDQDGCKALDIVCNGFSAKHQSLLEVGGQRLVSAPGGRAAITVHCVGDSHKHTWDAQGSNLFDVKTVSCNEKYLQNQICAPCNPLALRGGNYINVTYDYDATNGCQILKAKCSPVNQDSISSIEYRKSGDRAIIRQATATSTGGTADLSVECLENMTWIGEGNEISCYTKLPVNFGCDNATEFAPRIALYGDPDRVHAIPVPGQSQHLRIQCEPEAPYWSSKLTLKHSGAPHDVMGISFGDPGQPATLDVLCSSSSDGWLAYGVPVDEAICESKAIEDGCAMCDENSIKWDDQVIKRRSDVNGCKILTVRCLAPKFWRSQLKVNGHALISHTRGDNEIKIKCAGDRNGQRWIETERLNLTDINSVTCTKKAVDRGCEACDSISIAYQGLVPEETVHPSGCKALELVCKSDDPSSQALLEVDKHKMVSAPGGQTSAQLVCTGDNQRNGWDQPALKIHDVHKAACIKSWKKDNPCVKCRTDNLRLRGGNYLEVEYKYDNDDGCLLLRAKCAPVNQESISSIEFRSLGDRRIIDAAIAPAAGKAVIYSMSCKSPQTWRQGGNELGCYTVAPVNFDCINATVFAPKLTMFGDLDKVTFEHDRAGALNEYLYSCHPEPGYTAYVQIHYRQSDGTVTNHSLERPVDTPVPMQVKCEGGKWKLDKGDLVSVNCDSNRNKG